MRQLSSRIDLENAAVQAELLGRPIVSLLTPPGRTLPRRHVFVTGAGGALGRALALLLADRGAERVTLFDACEDALGRLEHDLAVRAPTLRVDLVLGDVICARAIGRACRRAQPDVVYHAASLERTPLLERSIARAVEVNVFGAWRTARAARSAGARFVLMSSDEAVDPRSVMAATLALAERAVLLAGRDEFAPLVVRVAGEILDARSGLLRLLLESLEREESVVSVVAGASRCFLTASEAAALVLEAELVHRDGQQCWVCVEPPVKMADVIARARRCLALYRTPGRPHLALPVARTRPRPVVSTSAVDEIDRARTYRTMRALRHDLARGDEMSALTDLCAAVPEFVPSQVAWEAACASVLSAGDVREADAAATPAA